MFKTLDTGVLIGIEIMHDWTTAKKNAIKKEWHHFAHLENKMLLESKSESLIWKLQNIEYFTAFHPPTLLKCQKKKLQNTNLDF